MSARSPSGTAGGWGPAHPGDQRRVLVEVGGHVPAGHARAVGIAGDAHEVLLPFGWVHAPTRRMAHAPSGQSAHAPIAIIDHTSMPIVIDRSPQDRVEHRRGRDQVGDVRVARHVRERLQVDERGVAHVHPRGLGGAVGAHVAAQLSAGGLDRVVDLPGRHAEALGDELEVVDQRLHRGRELVPGRQRDLAVLGDVRPLGQAVERLFDDVHRLVDLRHAHGEAVVVVADGADGDLEGEVVVGAVGVGLAQVPRVAGGAQQRTGDAEPQQRVGVERAHPAQPLQHDLVGVEDRAVLVGALGHDLQELAHLGLEAAGDVLDHAAHLEVARVHARAGGHLEQVEDQLALAQAVQEDRGGAEVEHGGAQPDQVRGDAVELQVDHAQVLRALGHLDLQQPLDGAAVGHRVEVVGEVVHPLDHGDHLPVGLVLGGLFDPRVHVPDDRFEVARDLSLERHQQPQHAVRGGVVGAEVERQQLVRGLVAGGDRVGADPGGAAHPRLVEREALLAAAVVGEGFHRGAPSVGLSL